MIIAAVKSPLFQLLAALFVLLGGIVGGRIAARPVETNRPLAGLVTGVLLADPRGDLAGLLVGGGRSVDGDPGRRWRSSEAGSADGSPLAVPTRSTTKAHSFEWVVVGGSTMAQKQGDNGSQTAGADGQHHLIELRQVRKVFRTPAGEFTALKDVDLQIGPGEFVAVIGKSGSGKSTLINMITGIDRPTRGEVFVDGTPVHKLSQDKLAKWRGRRVGVIFQFFQLLPTLTVLENLMLPMDFCNTYTRRERKARAMQLLERVELTDQAQKLPVALSGGQQQRVAIARALANDPPILVADEPTGNLDSKTADSVFRMFESLVDQGKTILMVTHDRDLAERVTRTVIISDGEIIEEYLAKAFPGLTEQQLVQAMRQLDRQIFPPGATVIREGAPPENFYIITEGEVEVHLRAPNGEEFVVARMGRGQYVGEIELLRGGNSIATVRASMTTGAEVAMLDPSEFAALMAESQAAKEAVAHIAEDRLAEHEAAVGRSQP